jgi:hypothetical protein
MINQSKSRLRRCFASSIPLIERWLKFKQAISIDRSVIRYSDDQQFIAFADVRYQTFENQCRWIELKWHEQMLQNYNETMSNDDCHSMPLYRELMSLVSGLQTSTPIVVEDQN